MKRSRRIVIAVLLVGLLAIGIALAGTAQAASQVSHTAQGLTGLNLSGGLCGFGQMVFLAPMVGLIWIAGKRKDRPG